MIWTAYFDSSASQAWIDSQAINKNALSLILSIKLLFLAYLNIWRISYE